MSKLVSYNNKIPSFDNSVLIVNGGLDPVISSLSVTENGTYEAPVGIDGYSPVTVSVPSPSGTVTINDNGLVDVSQYAKANVSVPASKVDTGTIQITENGEYSVIGYANANVSVESGAGKNIQHVNDGGDATSTSFVAKGSAITVAKTARYTCTWFAVASASSSSYYLSRLYVNGSAVGSNHTSATVSSNPIMTETLNLNKGDTIQIRARGRSTSYHNRVGLLTIEEV